MGKTNSRLKISLEDFELAKQDADFDFKIHYDLDGQATIDITEEDEWLQGKQLSLPYQYLDGDHSTDELISWLDKKLRFPMVSQKTKLHSSIRPFRTKSRDINVHCLSYQ